MLRDRNGIVPLLQDKRGREKKIIIIIMAIHQIMLPRKIGHLEHKP
jgi:hypothetical protein